MQSITIYNIPNKSIHMADISFDCSEWPREPCHLDIGPPDCNPFGYRRFVCVSREYEFSMLKNTKRKKTKPYKEQKRE
jgi:hypothetical protein